MVWVLEEIADLFFALLVIHLLVIALLVLEELLLVFRAVNWLFIIGADSVIWVLGFLIINEISILSLHLLVYLHLL